MLSHLKAAHDNEYSKLACSKSLTCKRPKLADVTDDDEAVTSSPSPKVYGPLDVAFQRNRPIVKHSKRWTDITRAITQLITHAMVPIRIVEQESFLQLIKLLEPGYDVPSRTYFSQKAIPQAYNNAVDQVLADFKRTDNFHFSITTDAWTSAVNLNPYVSLTCHFINNQWKLVSRNLATVYAPEDHTAANIAALMKDQLQEWSLDEKRLTCSTTDNGANMVAAMRENSWIRVPCFGHVLHNAVNQAMGDLRITRAKGVVKRITAVFSMSTKKRQRLTAAQVSCGLIILSM